VGYSQEPVEAVSCSEHTEAADNRPAAMVLRLDLDADLPGPSPLRGLPAPHYTSHTRRGDQEPLPTASHTQSKEMFM